MIRVQAVAPDSLGAAVGLSRGTELLAVNGRALEDFLDWEFLTAEDHFMLHVKSPAGEEIEYDIERPEGMPMGITLEPPRIRRCANHCDFCFVDGNPKQMRAPLYIRDDDYRSVVPIRQFRHPHEPEALGRRAHHRVSVVAPVRLGARHRPDRTPLVAAESRRPPKLSPNSARSGSAASSSTRRLCSCPV